MSSPFPFCIGYVLEYVCHSGSVQRAVPKADVVRVCAANSADGVPGSGGAVGTCAITGQTLCPLSLWFCAKNSP